MATDVSIDHDQASRLRRDNLVMAALHAAQGIAVVVLATDFTLPVTATYVNGPPGSTDVTRQTLFDLDLAWGVLA